MKADSVARRVKRVAKVRRLNQADLAKLLGVRKHVANALLRWPAGNVSLQDIIRVDASLKAMRRHSVAQVYRAIGAMAECGADNAEIESELDGIARVVRKVGSATGTNGNQS